jgi:hypothetical protein
MKKVFLKSSLLISAFALGLSFYSSVTHSNQISPDKIEATEIDGYKHWTPANPKPVKLDAQIAVMCAPASAMRQPDSPHANKFITVYVNDKGKTALLKTANPQFPQGTIIVKEKLANESATAPELLTVMLKREAGFNPPSNDWEFMVVNGDGKTVIERGKLMNCITCHTAKRQQDFVFRNYLNQFDLGKIK